MKDIFKRYLDFKNSDYTYFDSSCIRYTLPDSEYDSSENLETNHTIDISIKFPPFLKVELVKYQNDRYVNIPITLYIPTFKWFKFAFLVLKLKKEKEKEKELNKLKILPKSMIRNYNLDNLDQS